MVWKENYRLWMEVMNEYKNRGGRVTTGSDNRFIYQTYGFGYIRELELLREAGFHPLEVLRSATLYGAQALGREKEIGSVVAGKLADLVIIDANPLENLEYLYGTSAIFMNDKNEIIRKGGILYTIKELFITLKADVKKMADDEKAKTGFKITQPGMK